MVHPVGEAEHVDEVVDPRALLGREPTAGQLEREQHVLQHVEGRHQVVGLEDEPDVHATQEGAISIAHLVQRLAGDVHLSALTSSSPAATFMNVDLPEPEGPITAVKPPRGTTTVTSSRARTSPAPWP